ncbi:hypothetical protein WICPIJ_007622 [Wickerhamomyces pijperi]|uniref:PLP-dependent transferase n=1 Tax=Wickerhamomyces pijperi TaxID=599730 RepID=A0A9P8TJR1_WICPI|nr:hypothetical protein WICPIJ_007622 [Wickerhamomyces pijperi]
MSAQTTYLFQASLRPVPKIVSGKGVHVTVADKITGELKDLIDANSGAAVSSIAHGDEEIKQKMREAVENQFYTFPLIARNEPSEKLAKFIIDESKGAFATALFTGSGSESVENALKIMYKYHLENGEPQRTKFISRKQSYHGYTLGCLSIADNSRRAEYKDILLPAEQTIKVSNPYPYRNQKEDETPDQYTARLLAELEEAFQAAGPETVVGFVAETVGGSTFGCQTPPPGYLDGCRDICHKYGALFYLDEVMCGCGRMGALHAWTKYMTGPGPDIQTNGKTLGAGYVTIAAVLVGHKIMDLFKAKGSFVEGAQTYHNHAFNCEVALAVQEKVKREKLIENIDVVGAYLGEQLRAVDSKFIGNVRGAGGFWGVEFVKDKATKEPFEVSYNFYGKFFQKFYDNGVWSLTGAGSIDGNLGVHTVFSPAFSITKEEVDEIIVRFKKTMAELEDEYDASL